MFQAIKTVLKDLYRYQWIYLLRGILLQVLSTVAGSFILSELFYLVLLLARQDQLTQDNALNLLTNPWSLIGLIAYVLLLAALIYAEFALLVDIIRRKNRAVTWSPRRFARRCRDLVKTISGWQLLPFLAYVLLTVPVVQWLLSSTLLDRIHIPYFITDELFKQPVTAGALFLGGFLLYYLNLRLIYVMPITIIRFETRFWDNLVESWQLTKGKTLQLALALGILAIPIALIAGAIYLGLYLLLELMGTGLISKGFQWLIMTFIWGLSMSLTMVSKLVTVSYLLTQLDKHHLHTSYTDLPKVSRRKRWIALTGIFLLGLGQFAVNYDRLAYNPYNESIQTIAHRGDVTKGVENSLEALEAAAAHQVDYVEMDIILSKDNQFIVSHDNDLKRLTGQSISISDANADELIGLPIHQGDMTSQLVSFDTYVTKAKELNTKLMVELKPHGKEPDNYAQLVVDTFKKHGLTKTFKLMSLDLEVIETVEKLAPEIETGYIIPLQFGYLAGESLDFILIEDFSYRERLVWEAEWREQDLYVWTINREEQMTNYLQSPVAGVITDELDLLEETKQTLEDNNSYLDRLLRLIN